jgi:Type II secretion system (T2SS), protein E, N-terminal domain
VSVGVETTPAAAFDQAEGVRLPTSPDGRPGFLSDVIVELGLASPDAVEEAVAESRLVGKPPEEILVENEVITEEQVSIATAERNGLAYVDLFTFRVDDGAARLIDAETARRYRALPIAFDAAGALVVALADPMDALAVSDIAVITKSEVRAAVGSDAGIEALMRTLPASKRDTSLSAHARAAAAGAWTLSESISSPKPDVPELASSEDPIREVAMPAAAASAEPGAGADATQGLESRIEELVAAALDKRLDSISAPAPEPEPAAPASDPALEQELERTREELALTRAELEQAREDVARSREDAEQARAEVDALSARIEQLEGGLAPQPTQDPEPAILDDHLARVMRELEEPGPSFEG